MSEKRAESELRKRFALAGRKPCRKKDLDKAMEILAAAELGEVTSFVMVATGVDFVTMDWCTPTTRQDRLTLIGELQQQIYDLCEVERNERNNGR